MSPSSLENYASCPHRVFIEKVLRASIDGEPELELRLSPANCGTLIHRIFERFLSEPARDGEELLFGDSEEERLLAIAEEEFELCEERGQTGYAAFARADREELMEDLRAWLKNERLDEHFSTLPEGAYEVRFGFKWEDSDADGGLSSDDPIEISAGKAKLKVSGRIDRLDWNPDRSRFRVVDYKTGGLYGMPKKGRLDGGRALQLPIYMLAAAQVLGIPATDGEAEYHYSTRAGGFKRGQFDGTDFTARQEDLEFALSEMLTGMRTGVYHMAVEDRRQCRFCAADGLCPTSRIRIIERKSGDSASDGMDRVRELE